MQSSRRQAEDAEHDLRLLIDGAGDTALFKLDSSGRVASWNAGAERLLGYTAKQAIGLELSAFLTEDENENGKAQTMLATGERGVVYEDEDWRVRKDGSLLWAHSTLTPMRGESGELRGYAHVIRDLSEHKRLEDHLSVLALRDSLTQLPNRVLFLQHLDGAIARGRRKKSIARAALPRPRRLQGGQRQLRPRRRRRDAGPRGRPAAQLRCARATSSRGSAATSSPCSARA